MMVASMFINLSDIPRSFLIAGGSLLATGIAYYMYKRYSARIYQETSAVQNQELINQMGPKKNGNVLMLGLDGAGKSSILAALTNKLGQEHVEPTHGFNVTCIRTADTTLNIWEVGGHKDTRDYWKSCVRGDTGLLVYVIDGAEFRRFDESIAALKSVLTSKRLRLTPVYIVINKTDLCGTNICKAIYDKFLKAIPDLRSHSAASYCSTCVSPDGQTEGIEDFRNNLINMVASSSSGAFY